jgi:hypothetical protein
MNCNLNDILKFIDSQSPDFKKKLYDEFDPARVVSLIRFNKIINSHDYLKNIKTIAVVSEGANEPELELISHTIN